MAVEILEGERKAMSGDTRIGNDSRHRRAEDGKVQTERSQGRSRFR
jgi:hypothetical protein